MKPYCPLIEFTINHTFFEKGKCEDIDIIVARNEATLRNNYRAFLKKMSPWKYVFFVDQNENFEELSKLLERDIKDNKHFIEFLVVAKSRKFFSYTKDIGLLGGGNVVDWTIEFDSEKEVCLGVERLAEITTLNDPELCALVSKMHPTALACITLRFESGANGSISKRVATRKPLKIIIQFESRSAYWQYVLIPRKENMPSIEVVDMNRLVGFSEIKWSKTEDMQEAGYSYSDREIKLSEKYPFKLQLWEKHLNGQRLLLNNLSLPDPTNPANFSQDETMRNFISIYQYF